MATPVFDTDPSAMSGRRQICCERVTATYTCFSVVDKVMPLGLGMLFASRRSSPLALNR